MEKINKFFKKFNIVTFILGFFVFGCICVLVVEVNEPGFLSWWG